MDKKQTHMTNTDMGNKQKPYFAESLQNQQNSQTSQF